MAELIVIAGPNPGYRYPLPGASMTIGRSRERHLEEDDYLLLEDPKVSRRHLRVFREQAQWYVEDLNSSNGTALDSILLQQGALILCKMVGNYSSDQPSCALVTGKEAFQIPSGAGPAGRWIAAAQNNVEF